MRILALGDIFGEEAVKYVSARLGDVINKLNIDLTVANCENASGAQGVEPKMADSLLAAGCDVLTGGNHSFGKPAFLPYLEDKENVLRPANYPSSAPGSGYAIVRAADGTRVLVANFLCFVSFVRAKEMKSPCGLSNSEALKAQRQLSKTSRSFFIFS